MKYIRVLIVLALAGFGVYELFPSATLGDGMNQSPMIRIAFGLSLLWFSRIVDTALYDLFEHDTTTQEDSSPY